MRLVLESQQQPNNTTRQNKKRTMIDRRREEGHLLRNRPFSSSVARSCSLNETLVSSSSTESHTVLKNTFFSNSIATSQKHQVSPQHFINFRSFCSPPSGPSNVVLVKSEEQLNSALKKVQDESLPAVFYSTAGESISPKINELNETYPQVTTYKIDTDEVGLQNPLSKLIITSVSTFQFFQNGEKAGEYIGSNDSKLTNFYKKLANGKLKHKDVPRPSSISGPSDIVLVKSLEQLDDVFKKVKGELISPRIDELNETYPQVTTYKIDTDEVGPISLLRLDVTFLPTFKFFQNGEQADEYIGNNDLKLTSFYKKLANGKLANGKLKHKDVPRPSSISGPSDIVLVKSLEQLDDVFKKVKDKSARAVFFITTPWCGPGELISPRIDELNETYPQVTTYKIDTDEVGPISLLRLDVTFLPTFKFFQNGEQADEYIGNNDLKLTSFYKKLANGKLKHKEIESQFAKEAIRLTPKPLRRPKRKRRHGIFSNSKELYFNDYPAWRESKHFANYDYEGIYW